MSKIAVEAVRRAFVEASHVCCEYCGREVYMNVAPFASNRATADHRTPRCRGGTNARSNIAIACYACNHLKGALTAQEFLSLRDKPQQLAVARAFWARKLNGDATPRASKGEHRAAKIERRMERLRHRVRVPDPACVFCRATGLIRVSSRQQRYCVCTLAPLDPEAAAAHINGRHGQSAASL